MKTIVLLALLCGCGTEAAVTLREETIRHTVFNDQGLAVSRIVLRTDERVRDIGRRLVVAAAEPLWSRDIQVFVWHNELDERQMRPIAAYVRAFGTLPHRIILHRAVVRAADDDELAFLIAHELGHAALHEDNWQYRRAARLQFGLEQYADAFGVTVASRAGFNVAHATKQYCEFLMELERAEREVGTYAPDGLHPPTGQRCHDLALLTREYEE